MHSGAAGASGPQTSWERLNQILTNVGDLAYRRRILSIAEYLAPRPEHIILDLGAGEGFVQMALREAFGCRVVALDADAAILRQGLARGTETSGAVSLVGDGLRLPFPDGIFDAVVCSEVLEHVPDDAGVVGEIARVLKPGGIAALTVPCANYPGLWDPANRLREGACLAWGISARTRASGAGCGRCICGCTARSSFTNSLLARSGWT